MQNAEIFLILTIVLIFLLLLFQTVSVRIENTSGLKVTIEYFPIKLTLYNFLKTKIKKKKLIKRAKRLLFFLSPFIKALTFLLQRTSSKILSIDFPEKADEHPHKAFIVNQIEAAIVTCIYSFLYHFTKTTSVESILYTTPKDTVILFDFEFKTRFCNVIFAFSVFLFYLINKKGRNVNIVR